MWLKNPEPHARHVLKRKHCSWLLPASVSVAVVWQRWHLGFAYIYRWIGGVWCWEYAGCLFWDGGFWLEVCWDLNKHLVFQIDDWRCWDLRNLWVIMIENERNVHTSGLWKRGSIPWSYIIAQTLDSHEWFYMATDRASTHSFAGTQTQSFHSCMASQEDPAWWKGRICVRHVFAYYVGHLGCGLYLFVSTCGYPWYLDITSPMTWNTWNTWNYLIFGLQRLLHSERLT